MHKLHSSFDTFKSYKFKLKKLLKVFENFLCLQLELKYEFRTFINRHRLELMRQFYYNYYVDSPEEVSKDLYLIQYLNQAAKKLKSSVLHEDRSLDSFLKSKLLFLHLKFLFFLENDLKP